MPTTLLDIAKLNGSDAVVGLIEENLTYAPELSVFPARTMAGTSYKTSIRTGLPTTGFRNANEGFSPSKSVYKNMLVEAKIFGGLLQVDKAVAAADDRGAEHLKVIEAMGVMRSSLINIGSQIWYGTANDGKGFPGIQAFADATLTVDAGGTTANTGSSAYLVSLDPQNVELVFGNGLPFDLSPWREQLMADPVDATKQIDSWVSAMNAWVGLQLVNKFSVVCIKNLTAEAGKGLTDSLISQALEKLPVGYIPSYIFMNRRSRGQLQRSRSVTIFSGAGGKAGPAIENIAPLPTESMGVPIMPTDSLVSTEAIR